VGRVAVGLLARDVGLQADRQAFESVVEAVTLYLLVHVALLARGTQYCPCAVELEQSAVSLLQNLDDLSDEVHYPLQSLPRVAGELRLG